MAGKGDTYRPVDWDKYGDNYDSIFRKDQPEQTWYYCDVHPQQAMNYRNPCPLCEQAKDSTTQRGPASS